MCRLTSANHLRSLFTAAAAATATTYSSRHCVADPPPPPLTYDFVNVGEKGKIRGDGGAINGRKMLPPKLLSENVAMLTCDSSADGGICNVYLIGTRHGSPESRREVKDVIQFLKPEVVFLELCSSRLIYEPELGKIRIAGGEESEFFVAFDQAMKYGAKVILGDQPIDEITEKIMTANMSNWDSLKLLYYATFQKKPANLDASISASVKESIVRERDQYMSAKILEVARVHNSIVAVVGKDHLAGIQKNWKQRVELERLSLPAEKNQFTTFIILNSVVVAAVGAWAVTILRRLSKK